MGKVIIPDGAGGFVLPWNDILEWASSVSEEPIPGREHPGSLKAITLIQLKLRAEDRRLSLCPVQYRWSETKPTGPRGPKWFESSYFLTLQWKRNWEDQLVPGPREKKAEEILEKFGYKGRKEWIVTGETDRFHCLGCDY